MNKTRISVLIALTGLLVLLTLNTAHAGQKRYSDRADVKAFIAELVKKHNFNRAELLGMFKRAKPQQKALEALEKPAERELTWGQYRPIFVTDKRIDAGVEFWQNHSATLQKAEEKYGVPKEIIVAIIGVETLFGKHTGTYPVLETLITLSFDAKSRQPFWRKELEEFLLLAKEQQVDPFSIQGSYAGAMGWGQFISSSYRAYAVDFDDDGKRDLWTNPVDAIGSVANYFKRHGWNTGELIAIEAMINGNEEGLSAIAVGRARGGLKPELTLKELSNHGVKLSEQLPADEVATLVKLEGSKGDEYWLGFKNFYVITRYNQSAMYAMAVYQLSREIKQKANSVLVELNGKEGAVPSF